MFYKTLCYSRLILSDGYIYFFLGGGVGVGLKGFFWGGGGAGDLLIVIHGSDIVTCNKFVSTDLC